MNSTPQSTDLSPEELRVICAEEMGWKLVPEGSTNPPPISFRMCPICGYYGSKHEGRNGMSEDCPPDHESQWVAGFNQWTMDNKETHELPDYPTDANAALLLCDEMAKRGWRTYLNQGTGGAWECEMEPTPKGEKVYAPADTAQLAIARCFAIATGRAS